MNIGIILWKYKPELNERITWYAASQIMNRPEGALRPEWGSELIHDAGFDDVVGAGTHGVLPLQQVEFVLHVG